MRRVGSKALHYIASQHLGFFDARGFFENPSDADAQEDVAVEDVERSRDPVTHPVGFLTEPLEVARFRRVLLTFGTTLVRGSGGWNCVRQNLRGASAEDLPGAGATKATVIDFANVAVRKRHCDIRIPPFGCTLGFVSLTGSPCTASISALVSSRHTSISSLAEGGTSPAFVFCGGPPGAWLAISEAGEKSNPQNKKRSRGLWLINVYCSPDRR